MKYENHTNEELVSIIAATGDEEAYEQLFRNIDPITLHEAQMYLGKMDTYDREDFLQEGRILAWTIISKGSFKKGLFRVYFGSAIRKRLVNIYRTYTLKNLVCIDEQVDCRGNVTRTMVESDYARAYREKHREQCRAWYAKKKASQPPKEAKPKMTIEEKRAKAAAYQRAYKEAHPEKYERRKAIERERQRRKAAERRAARMATA
jgi:hypothetical protein